MADMTFGEWLDYGVQNGYCTEQFCATHDGGPMSEREVKEWEEGGDPCNHVVRIGTEEDWG